MSRCGHGRLQEARRILGSRRATAWRATAGRFKGSRCDEWRATVAGSRARTQTRVTRHSLGDGNKILGQETSTVFHSRGTSQRCIRPILHHAKTHPRKESTPSLASVPLVWNQPHVLKKNMSHSPEGKGRMLPAYAKTKEARRQNYSSPGREVLVAEAKCGGCSQG